MNRYVIVDGLPYLVADNKYCAVRWDQKGFTVGAEVELPSVPKAFHTELEIMAKCAGRLDSIGDEKPHTGRRKQEKKAGDAIDHDR